MRSKISDQLSAFVDDATRESFGALLNATEEWLNEKKTLQDATPKTQAAVLLSADIEKKAATLERVATPILNRPKPAPKKEEPPAETEEAEPMEDGSEPEANADGEETNDETMDDAADSLD